MWSGICGYLMQVFGVFWLQEVSDLGYVFFILFLGMFTAFILGLIRPKWVIRNVQKQTRRHTGVIYGSLTFLFFLAWMFSLPSAGPTPAFSKSNFAGVVNGTTTNGSQQKAASENVAVANATGKPSKVSTKRSSTAAIKPMSYAQMEQILQWGNQQYIDITSRFDGLQPGTYRYVDPNWNKFARDELSLITQKEHSFPNTKAPAIGGDEVQWMIQADVNSAIEQVWQTLASMNEYLGAGGNPADINQNESIYKHFFKKATQEVQVHHLAN
ncbi:hypothetical protein LLE49_19530 [Alicyclobacillus tolerans]|uniref:hypothetical protein n=1 Tax=Alicyclobacillus tolerans TaxID=90970 RepID=UPI001F1B8B0D|nr:hypothetical protein [Alicyclobacillus tolerans]MCF8566914.1 hypothetical protein [Alicyclobacillus tolerans]